MQCEELCVMQCEQMLCMHLTAHDCLFPSELLRSVLVIHSTVMH